MDYLLHGILIGLLFGLPVGAVGTMTVQHTWNSGIKAGLFTGLGSSVADCFYAVIGVFGITFISDFLLDHKEKNKEIQFPIHEPNIRNSFMPVRNIRIITIYHPINCRLFSCVTVIAILLSGCASGQRESSFEPPALSSSETTQAADDSSDLSNTQQTKPLVESTSPESQPSDNSTTEENTVEKMNLQVGNNSFTATLESNAAVDALVDMMREAPVIIQMSDYSGFEKVGSLGTSLPTSNSQITTKSGDIVLYNGNQIVIFYGSNSWSYTRLGRIDDLSGWEDALGNGGVTVTFSVG